MLRETNNPSVADYLSRAVLDDEFRKLALTSPEQACANFTLTAEEQDILQARDERMLALLGAAIRDSWSSPSPLVPDNGDVSTNEPVADAFQPIPPVALRLRLIPRLSSVPGGGDKVQYAATIFPWPDAAGPVYPSSGDGTVRGSASGEINVLIRIFTTRVATTAQEDRIACSVAIEPLSGSTSGTSPVATLEQPGALQRGGDLEVQAVAQTVREAPPAERYDRLLDLLRALQPGDRHA